MHYYIENIFLNKNNLLLAIFAKINADLIIGNIQLINPFSNLISMLYKCFSLSRIAI